MSTNAVTTQQRMSADEFFAWCNCPENRDRHFELERGKVVEVSHPGERHGFVCLNVGRILSNYTFGRRKGYALGNDTGVILERDPDTVRAPDVVLDDQARRYDDLSAGYCERPPTLAVEVLSLNDRWGKVTRRISQFLGQGVAVVWVVDPEGRSATVYRPKQLPQVFEGEDELTGEPEMPGFRCRVADLFYMPGEEVPPGQPSVG
jgi:Uma2 family endonuclease